jgi:hypothetical protein
LERLGIALLGAADKTSDRSTIRWVLLGATVGTYVWNLVDAFTLGAYEENMSTMGLSLRPSADGFQAGLTWRLPS